jgi:hypothetical protein
MNTDDAMSLLCPVCGYGLGFQAWDGDLPSDEICRCCGIQFGYFDAGPTLEHRTSRHNQWRDRWFGLGMPWNEGRSKPPPNWNPKEQLRRIGQDPDSPSGTDRASKS